MQLTITRNIQNYVGNVMNMIRITNLTVKSTIKEPNINAVNVKEDTIMRMSVKKPEVRVQAEKISEYSIIKI